MTLCAIIILLVVYPPCFVTLFGKNLSIPIAVIIHFAALKFENILHML